MARRTPATSPRRSSPSDPRVRALTSTKAPVLGRGPSCVSTSVPSALAATTVDRVTACLAAVPSFWPPVCSWLSWSPSASWSVGVPGRSTVRCRRPWATRRPCGRAWNLEIRATSTPTCRRCRTVPARPTLLLPAGSGRWRPPFRLSATTPVGCGPWQRSWTTSVSTASRLLRPSPRIWTGWCRREAALMSQPWGHLPIRSLLQIALSATRACSSETRTPAASSPACDRSTESSRA